MGTESSQGRTETPRERIERLVAEGRKARADLERALLFWRQRLQAGILLPTGEMVRITLDDLYHLLVDDRILRKPERIELILLSIFEIRQARQSRRRVLSAWQEGERHLFGFAILDSDSRVRTMHVIDERDLRKYAKEPVLWSRSELPSSGMGQKQTSSECS